MSDRVSERQRAAQLAHHYRDQENLPIAEIARRLGRSEATVKAYLYDPSYANKRPTDSPPRPNGVGAPRAAYGASRGTRSPRASPGQNACRHGVAARAMRSRRSSSSPDWLPSSAITRNRGLTWTVGGRTPRVVVSTWMIVSYWRLRNAEALELAAMNNGRPVSVPGSARNGAWSALLRGLRC